MSILRVAVVALALTVVCAPPATAAVPDAVQKPASAQDHTVVPEPSDFALFLLGVAGLVIGRRTARSRAARDEDASA